MGAACIAVAALSCRPAASRRSVSPPTVAAVRQAPDARVSALLPNELGFVPVLMYHEIGPREGRLIRSAANFRRDLTQLYSRGYRPITATEYLTGRIDLPAGASPVVITFDDARRSQFCRRPDGSIDPNCAVGILLDFHRRHPDFAMKATFFVLPLSAFGQPKFAKEKLRDLLRWGCEIGNHTVTHRNLRLASNEAVQREIGECAQLIESMAPGAPVQSVAFPGGHTPHNAALILTGESNGRRYTNLGGFLAGDCPAPAPAARIFTPYRVPRIEPGASGAGIDSWLKRLDSGDPPRYVSDGDPVHITAPRRCAALLDTARADRRQVRLE